MPESGVVDPADELAYLALECERLHAPQVGRWLLDERGTTWHDGPLTLAVTMVLSLRIPPKGTPGGAYPFGAKNIPAARDP